jgi:hypothetical protein
MVSPAQRVVIATAAGLSLVTATPASADDSWTVTDHSGPRPSWTVTDYSGPHRERSVSRKALPRRVRRTRATVRYPWRPSTTCRVVQGRTWRVGPGDTLSLVADCHPGVTVDGLRAVNGLRGDLIRVGQVLRVPAVTR